MSHNIENTRPVLSQFRQYPGTMGKVVFGLSIALAIFIILYVSDTLDRLGINLFGPFRALTFAFLLVLTFLLVPATKSSPRDRLPWYDAALAVLGLLPSLYIASVWSNTDTLVATVKGYQIALAMILFVVTFEAARRTVGWSIVAIGIFFVIYALFGSHFPGLLTTRSFSLSRITAHYYIDSIGFFGPIMDLFVTIVAVYLFFGQFLLRSGASDFLMKLALSVSGHVRGGPAKAAVVGSALFGTMSGSPMANVVTTGTVTIPLMKRVGYKPHFAGAVEAVASTGGSIMPPVMGAVAFVLADFLELPYWSVVVAAFIPAVLYFLAVFVMVDLEAARTDLRGLPRSELPSLLRTLRGGWQFFVPLIVLIFFMGVLHYSAVTSGLYAMLAAILISLPQRGSRLGPRKMAFALDESVKGLMQIGPAVGIMGLTMAAVNLTGLGLTLASGLVRLASGDLFILLALAALASYIMGMGISMLVSYVVLAILVAPALVQLGVLPLAAHMFIFYMGVSAFITPPVAMAAFAAAPIAGANPMRIGIVSMRLGIVAFLVPFAFVYSPSLLMQGSPQGIVLAVLPVTIGVLALTAGFSGYLFRVTFLWERVLMGVGGVGLIIPWEQVLPAWGVLPPNLPAWVTDTVSLCLVLLPALRQLVFLKVGRRTAAMAVSGRRPTPAVEDR
ncbi:MAG: TRAP transporter fused permease subunit [Chloroflexi bacterium]|nr:TRAP transporter fused permease subunit [Chloroflexota bacterium]